MTKYIYDGGPAFPCEGGDLSGLLPDPGMTLRDYFAGQVLANSGLCTGNVADWQLSAWFGEHGAGISREQIAARQSYELADAMLKARGDQS